MFDRKFLQTIVTRVDANDEIYKKILDDEDFRAALGEFYLRKVYERLRGKPDVRGAPDNSELRPIRTPFPEEGDGMTWTRWCEDDELFREGRPPLPLVNEIQADEAYATRLVHGANPRPVDRAILTRLGASFDMAVSANAMAILCPT